MLLVSETIRLPFRLTISGLLKIMIANEILKTSKTLEERGLPKNSYFEVVFFDGSIVSEINTNWSAMSRKEQVDYFGRPIVAFISNYPVKSIKIKLNDMEALIDEIPEDCEVYQFVRSERILGRYIDKESIIGRGIGLIKNGAVVEERFINALENNIQGMKR